MDNGVLEKYKIKFDDELKKKIIDAVVQIYGESCRALMEERIDRIELIQYITPDDINKVVRDSLSSKKKELAIKFLEKMGVDFEEGKEKNITQDMEKMLQIYFGGSEFSPERYTNIFAFDPEVEENDYSVSKKCKLLTDLGVEGISPDTYDEFLRTPEGQAKLTEINQTLYIIKTLIEEYKDFENNELSEEKNYLEACEQLKLNLNNEGIKEYYESIKEFLTQEEREEMEEIFRRNTSGKYSFFRKKCGKYFTNDVERVTPVEVFAEDYDGYDKRSKMVDYFRACGLDLGYDYSAYEDNEEAKKLIPTQELIKKIREQRQKASDEVKKKYFMQTGTIGEDLQRLKVLGLLAETGFSQDFVENKVTCIEPNAVLDKNNNLQSVNLLYFPILKNNSIYADVRFIHELLHVLEGKLEKTDDGYVFSTGFESVRMDFEIDRDESVDIDDKYEHNIRKYEIFSENIHQRLSMDVTAVLHSQGINIVNSEVQRISGGTEYEHFNSVTRDFYDKFRSQIAYARVTGSIDRFKDRVGKENFEQLNDLVMSFRDLPYYELMNDYSNKRETPITQKANSIISQAQGIVKDMEKAQGMDR